IGPSSRTSVDESLQVLDPDSLVRSDLHEPWLSFVHQGIDPTPRQLKALRGVRDLHQTPTQHLDTHRLLLNKRTISARARPCSLFFVAVWWYGMVCGGVP